MWKDILPIKTQLQILKLDTYTNAVDNVKGSLKNMVLPLWSWKLLRSKCCRAGASAIICPVWSNTHSSELLVIECLPVSDTENTTMPRFSDMNRIAQYTKLSSKCDACFTKGFGWGKLSQSCLIFPSGATMHNLICSCCSVSSWKRDKLPHLSYICCRLVGCM